MTWNDDGTAHEQLVRDVPALVRERGGDATDAFAVAADVVLQILRGPEHDPLRWWAARRLRDELDKLLVAADVHAS